MADFLVSQFQATLDPKTLTEATKRLDEASKKPGFSLAVLQLVSNNGVQIEVRQAAAIYFKNFIMRNWVPDEDGKDILPPNDRQTIKQHLPNLMLSSPNSLQQQLSQALAIVAKTDFPENWKNLLPDLLSKTTTTNEPSIVQGSLTTMHSLFYHYRTEMQSQKLWEEIKLVTDQVFGPLLDLWKRLVTQVPQQLTNKAALTLILQSLNNIVCVFHSLNSQDIIAFVQDSLAQWFAPMLELLNFRTKQEQAYALVSGNSDDPTCVEELLTNIVDCVTLFATKYEEDFKDLLPKFVELLWNVLTSLPENKNRFSQLIRASLSFLTVIATKQQYKHLFASEQAVRSLMEKILLKQLLLTSEEEELFEENPIEYIRRDIEGSDQETRRRSAQDLIRKLIEMNEGAVSAIILQYQRQLLVQYKQNPKLNYKQKELAIVLMLVLAVKKQTQQKGATQLSSHVDVATFMKEEILPELAAQTSASSIIRASALKFLLVMRSQLPKESLLASFQFLLSSFKNESVVIHSYGAIVLEKLLLLKQGDGQQALLDPSSLQPFLTPFLSALFNILEQFEESRENEYVMKALLRLTCSVLPRDLASMMNVILQKLSAILKEVAKNPQKPEFHHYLFETQSALVVRFVQNEKEDKQNNPSSTGASVVDLFEQALFPIYQQLLSSEQTRDSFSSYIFQVLSLLLEERYMLATSVSPSLVKISAPFMSIFPVLINSSLYQNQAHLIPLIRLLCAFLKNGIAQPPADTSKPTVFTKERLEGLLGIFQLLLSSSRNENLASQLMRAIIEFVPASLVSPFFTEVQRQSFQRLSSTKNPNKTLKQVLQYWCVWVTRQAQSFNYPQSFVMSCEQVQKGIFAMVMEKMWLPQQQLLFHISEKKQQSGPETEEEIQTKLLLSANAQLISCLSEHPAYNKYMQPLLVSTLSFYKQQQTQQQVNNDGAQEDEEDELEKVATGSGLFAKLLFAPEPVHDPLPSVKNAFSGFVAVLKHLPQPKIQALGASLTQEQQALLQDLLKQ